MWRTIIYVLTAMTVWDDAVFNQNIVAIRATKVKISGKGEKRRGESLQNTQNRCNFASPNWIESGRYCDLCDFWFFGLAQKDHLSIEHQELHFHILDSLWWAIMRLTSIAAFRRVGEFAIVRRVCRINARWQSSDERQKIYAQR